MNIKQAESLTGISRRNIRFYEHEGMLHPTRNQENDYREYSDADIRTLKLIRALRMVDMPLEQIRNIIAGKTTIGDAAAIQEERLSQKAKELETAIAFCRIFRSMSDPAGIDTILAKMDAPENRSKLFRQWVSDYRQLSQSMGKKAFTFIPDDAVTTPGEFSLVLCKYADANHLDLVITKEGMYPEFTIDGIEYTAERYYTRMGCAPVATVRCTAKHPQELEPDLPLGERIILKLFHYSWILIIFILLNAGVVFRGGGLDLFSSWQGWLVFISFLVLTGVSLLRFLLFTYNNKDK